MRWVIGILVVVVLVIIGYQYFGDRGVDVAEQPEVGVTDEAEVAEEPAEPPAEVAEPAEPAPMETEQAAEEPAEPVDEAAEATPEAPEPPAMETAEEAPTTGEAAEQPAEVATPAEEATEPAPEELAEEAEQVTEEVAEEGTEPAPGVAQVTEAQMAALVVGDINVGEQVTDAVQNIEETLQGVTDAQSAEAAVPQLNAVNTRLEELSSTVDQLPDEAKKVLADVLSERVEQLKTLAADVTAQEGVGEVVNPALEPIIAKLEDWSQQPA
jgi:hypothetical protein